MNHVTRPESMNAAFAEAVNAKDLDRLLELYEPTAVLRTEGDSTYYGLDEIRAALENLLDASGTLDSRNAYCISHGDIALLRADYVMKGHDGATIMQGSSAEVVHRGDDGRWRYIVDHATGASVASDWLR